MWRACIAVCVGISLTATSVAQIQVPAHTASGLPGGDVQRIDLWKMDISKVSDAFLGQFIGFEGRAAESTDSNRNAAMDELKIRAEERKDGRAAYLLGRESQVPANPAMLSVANAAAKWYLLGTSLNDPAAADAYSMCLRWGYGGVTKNIAQADKLHAWALAHGYDEAQDRQGIAYNEAHPHQRPNEPMRQLPTQTPTVTDFFEGALAAIGVAAVLSGSSTSKATRTGSETPSPDTGPKFCHIYKSVWVNDPGMAQGHYEQQYVPAQGYECP